MDFTRATPSGRMLGRETADLPRYIAANTSELRRRREKEGTLPKRGRKAADVDIPDLPDVRRAISCGIITPAEGAKKQGISVAAMYRRFSEAGGGFKTDRY